MHISDARLRLGIFSQVTEPALHDPYWDEVIRGRRHITLVPPAACGTEAAPYFPFSLLAADHDMTINTGYLARFDGMRWSAYCDGLQRQLNSGKRDVDMLYIVHADQVDHFQQTSSVSLDCRRADGYAACVVPFMPSVRDQPAGQ
jgi:hypothetical protein